MGVRSMCVMVQTPDIKLIVDPGCALGPFREKFSPHPLEYEKLISKTKQIVKTSREVDYIIISHYHFDHLKPRLTDYFTIYTNPEIFEEIYSNKNILTKDPENKCSRNATSRGRNFIKQSGKIAQSVEIADNNMFQEGDTKISFSRAVPHGELNSPNSVIMTTVRYQDECVLHSSDVQGPLQNETKNMIFDINPNLAIIGGPPIYLKIFERNVAYKVNSIKNMVQLMENIPITIFDHHLLRMKTWKEYCNKIIKNIGKKSVEIETFASYFGEKEELLEAKRKELYQRYPVSQDFKKWLLLEENSRKFTPPPLD